MIGRLVVAVLLLVHSAACLEEASIPFVADLTYEPVAEAGGQSETNDLFISGPLVPWLVDSTVVAYTDQAVRGRIVVADIVLRTGWSISHQCGADGPGELNGRMPWLSSSGDTVKTLREYGRLAARLKDGSLLYDSLIPRTFRPGMLSFTAGLAGNRRVAEYHVQAKNLVQLGILLESVSADPLLIPLDTVLPDPGGGFSSTFMVRARGDIVVILRDHTVTTMDVQGRQIAQRQIPWRSAYNAFVDGTGRVWVQVVGGVRGGYNLMLFTRELELIGQAIIPHFRDAFGDYVLSVRRDSLDVETMILSRLKH